jgi:hypothetical protein
MDINDSLVQKLLEQTVGIEIEVLSNNYQEMPGMDDSVNTHQEIVFQIKEEEPDIWAIGVLYTLSLVSFSYASPRGLSEADFIPDEQWILAHFVAGLEFEGGILRFSSDYVSGRMMKTDIAFEPGGKVTLTTTNRGKGAETWLSLLQGKRHIRRVK